MTRGPFAAGDRVLLIDSKRRRHLVVLAADGEFHSHAGVLRHDELIGADEGVTVRTTMGARLTINGNQARGTPWKREREGRPFSTCALAFSESWTEAR